MPDEYEQLMGAVMRDPLVIRLADLARKVAGVNLLLIYPKADNWEQQVLGSSPDRPEFCRRIQCTRDGARNCRMCHVLMTVASCGKGVQTEQTCHAGAHVLVTPVSRDATECFAILSSCVYLEKGDKRSLQGIADQGRKLGINPDDMKRACSELPRLSSGQVDLAHELMTAVGEAVRLVRDKFFAEGKVEKLQRAGAALRVGDTVTRELRLSFPIPVARKRAPRSGDKRAVPALVSVVRELVIRKPNMPYNVAEIAAAARVSPNYFSALFRKHQKQNFSDFLTDRRVMLAKELLGNLNLNLSEISHMVGYDDPAYFARRFRRKTGMSPRQWRQNLEVGPGEHSAG